LWSEARVGAPRRVKEDEDENGDKNKDKDDDEEEENDETICCHRTKQNTEYIYIYTTIYTQIYV